MEIILVTPISMFDSEKCFNTMKCIETFLRNTMSEERLNNLTYLFIHKEYTKEGISDLNISKK